MNFPVREPVLEIEDGWINIGTRHPGHTTFLPRMREEEALDLARFILSSLSVGEDEDSPEIKTKK